MLKIKHLSNFLTEYCYNKSGKNLFSDGNGNYRGSIISGYKQTTSYLISGNIKNGKFDGKWTWSGNHSIAAEYFENGNFIKGSSYGLVYKTNPKVSLKGFELHENVDIFKFSAIPNSSIRSYSVSQMLKYKNAIKLGTTFTPEMVDHLKEFNTRNNIFDYWCLVQFIVTKQNYLVNLVTFSNNNLVSNDIMQYISTLTGFEAAKPGDIAEDCAVYLCIYCEKGIVNIPEYGFNMSVGIMDLIPNK